MRLDNPFTLTFGLEPNLLIKRDSQINIVEEEFTRKNPSKYMYLITGVRGSGKTVLLSSLSKKFKTKDDWIVIDLNPELNLLESLASQIYEKSHMKFKFAKKEFSFSFQCVTFSIKGETPVVSIETLLEKMLNVLQKQNKKVLICIDEVSATQNIKAFCQQFQILIRNKFPIFLLMTGLFENIRNLQEQKTLTFLYRCPLIELTPLKIQSICESYKEVLKIDEVLAIKLAKLTKGYAYAYQVVGYVCFEHRALNFEEAVQVTDTYLRDYVYEKIWNDLPQREKDILIALADSTENSVALIMHDIKMDKQTFSPYRMRLIKKGILTSNSWGTLDFALPRFKEFVLDYLKYSF